MPIAPANRTGEEHQTKVVRMRGFCQVADPKLNMGCLLMVAGKIHQNRVALLLLAAGRLLVGCLFLAAR